MTDFILVWVLVTRSAAAMGANMSAQVYYSPPLKTLEDCQRLQQAVEYGKCVQVNVLRGYVK